MKKKAHKSIAWSKTYCKEIIHLFEVDKLNKKRQILIKNYFS